MGLSLNAVGEFSWGCLASGDCTSGGEGWSTVRLSYQGHLELIIWPKGCGTRLSGYGRFVAPKLA